MTQAESKYFISTPIYKARGRRAYVVGTKLSDLQAATGLSRSVVLTGIARAVDFGLLRFGAGGPRVKSTFELMNTAVFDGRRPFAERPFATVQRELAGFDIRLDATLAALKIYLVMLAARDSNSLCVSRIH